MSMMHRQLKLFFFLICIILSIHTNSQNKRFFDFNEGLSNSLINKVYQDHLGFIWVATEDGLNRFDGMRFKKFTQKDNRILANYITTIFDSQDGTLWFGFINGLMKYNHLTNKFEEVKMYVNNEQIHPFITSIVETNTGDIWYSTYGYGLFKIPKTLRRPRYSTRLNQKFCTLNIRTLIIDSSGILWLGSDNEGVNSFNPITNKIQYYSTNIQKDNKTITSDITSIAEGKHGNIFFGSLKNGLCYLNKQTNQIIKISDNRDESGYLPVKSLLFDSHERLWVGTDGKGMRQYNFKKKRLDVYATTGTSFDFAKSKIHSIIEDQSGNIWAGVFQKGLFLFPGSKQIFINYGYNAFGDNSIGSSCITAIDGDQNNIWNGTDGDGIYVFDRQNQKIKHIICKNPKGVEVANNIFSINATDKEYLWVGTYSGGLVRYHKSSGKIKIYKNSPKDSNSLPNDIITCIKKDNQNNYWLGTFGAGVVHFNPNKEIFKAGLPLSDSLNHQIPLWVNDVYIDDNQNFWIATYVGLIFANIKEQSLRFYTIQNGSLPSNVVYCLKNDNFGNLWIGTYEGLVKFDKSERSFTTYKHQNKQFSNVICAIEIDEFGKLWLSTHGGLNRFDPNTSKFTNYTASDGLQSNEFSRNATYKTKDNRLFFGGINGITELNRNYQNFKLTPPRIILTNLNRFNKEVNIGDKSGGHTILKKPIVLADTIHFVENDNNFSIGFTSMNLAKQSRIFYEYIMEGFDNQWNTSFSNNRNAVYTNLPHGKYTFKVRGIDKKMYSKARKLTIIIHPPWYKTIAAKLFWIFITGIIVFIIIQAYKEKFKRIEIERLNENKMQFFINISHEIRTPLSLIIDPIDKLLAQKSDAETKRLYKIMQQNSNRIFKLINQLLDIRKIDKKQMLIKFQKTNLFDFIKEIADSYKYLATCRNIQFDFNCKHKNIEAWIDPLNFEKVIINLLSNAFKFTSQEGKVEINLYPIEKNTNKNWVEIAVIDTGIGIKKTDLERIFERFYQVDSSETRNTTGTGIGLHLSKSLVELHKGRIFAEIPTEGKGTIFKVQIPLGNQHLPMQDLIIDKNRLPAPIHSNRIKHTHIDPINLTKGSKNKPHIMIIEDELEIRNYLVEELSPKYRISAFENGYLASAQLLNEQPDLIISDIMMPVMDGITFCKRVKNNIETSHIPIILLTALSKEEDKAEGIETGADMYLIKPFNTVFLQKSIINLLENRRKIAEKHKNTANKYDIKPVEIKSHDEILMQKVMSIIKDNMSNSDLNVEMLADGVGISRVHMHRKLKEITNLSARELIKNIRMKQAAYILINKKMNISEVAYAVGYSSLSHFSTSFKGYYGVSPKEYVIRQTINLNK